MSIKTLRGGNYCHKYMHVSATFFIKALAFKLCSSGILWPHMGNDDTITSPDCTANKADWVHGFIRAVDIHG